MSKYPLCRCEDCPLKDRPVCVPPERNNDAKLFILGETPAKNEEIEGRPFVGSSGRLLESAFTRFAFKRQEAILSNVLLCWPGPGKKLKPEEWKRAIACCKPRLEAELQVFKSIVRVALGARALHALGGPTNITAWAGAPLDLPSGQCFPSIHPAAALRRPSLIPVFKIWIGRAIQLARGELPSWQWPKIIIEPGPEMQKALEEIANSPVIGVDIENYGDALETKIRCIGVSSDKCAVSVPIENEGLPLDLVRSLRACLLAPGCKVLHNSQHDRLGLEQNGWEIKGPFYDTLFAHAVAAPQLPHDLGFVASVESHAPRWKSELHAGSEDRGLALFSRAPWEKLGPYNAKDCFMQQFLYKCLERRIARTHNGHALLQTYHALGEIAVKMRRRGAQINPARFQGHKTELTARLDKYREEFSAIVGTNKAFTLGKSGQHPSLKPLFFGKLGLTPVRYSEDTGEPALDSLTLENYCSNPSKAIATLARTVLSYRKTSKLLGTYIEGLPFDKENIVHSTWKCYGTLTGRWSSASPNLQNCPKIMRDLYMPRPGRVLVAGDYSQLELRFITLFSGDEALLQAYKDGVDVHKLNASVCFGVPIDKVTSELRKLGKIFIYGSNYLGDPETIWRQIVVQFPETSLGMIYKAHKAWFKAHPKIREWQMNQLKQARENKYVEEPLSGRREYFHDGLIEPNKVVNFPIQGAAGTLINRAIIQLDRALEWAKESILFQVHDELVLEGPDKARLTALLRTHMNQEFSHQGNTMAFPIECKSGQDWRNMTPVD